MIVLKKLSKILVISMLIISTCLTGGCKQKADESSDNDQRQRKIAVVISTLNNPWFVVLGDTAKSRAEELGYKAVVFDSQNNTAKETSHFENIIAGGYQAIIFNPTDADASITNVRRAKKAGIPVFCVDREINSNEDATAQILSDNYTGCVAIGEYFVKVGRVPYKYSSTPKSLLIIKLIFRSSAVAC